MENTSFNIGNEFGGGGGEVARLPKHNTGGDCHSRGWHGGQQQMSIPVSLNGTVTM